MEFRINLLPQTYSTKEKSSVFLVPVLGIVAVVITAFVLTYTYFDKKNSIENLSINIESQTQTRDTLLKEYQEKTTGVTAFNFTDQYKATAVGLSTIYVDSSKFHERVKSILPEKSDVTAYTYNNNGDLSMTVNFYSKGDSAIYLDRLLNAPFVNEVKLTSITVDGESLTYDSTFELKVKTLVGVDQ
ncbi:hypothetical protein R4Z10_16610 [Niallia sp. XMNu-256]|uniref:hypothetical protein n=1 Tax=Niallia sp. XMNu-256 TaxID=3082444 RepID=UPI0030D25175